MSVEQSERLVALIRDYAKACASVAYVEGKDEATELGNYNQRWYRADKRQAEAFDNMAKYIESLTV